MKFVVNFQYRPKQEGARPQDEPILDITGELLTIKLDNGGVIPNVGDHVHFHRAGARKNSEGNIIPVVEPIEGVVENRLFRFFTNEVTYVNIVVTDSSDEVGGMLIKE